MGKMQQRCQTYQAAPTNKNGRKNCTGKEDLFVTLGLLVSDYDPIMALSALLVEAYALLRADS